MVYQLLFINNMGTNQIYRELYIPLYKKGKIFLMQSFTLKDNIHTFTIKIERKFL